MGDGADQPVPPDIATRQRDSCGTTPYLHQREAFAHGFDGATQHEVVGNLDRRRCCRICVGLERVAEPLEQASALRQRLCRTTDDNAGPAGGHGLRPPRHRRGDHDLLH
jgi:hypothetical protein